MNPYNQPPYGFPQQTPGPPQPPWQAPPRRQGWGDPRLHGQPQQPPQPQSPASPYHAAGPSSNAFGSPLPPPAPPSQYPPAPPFDTHQWGVRYNQGLAAPNQNPTQHQEPKPALPPRPSSAAGRISPQPHQTAYSQQPAPAPSQQQYPTSWNDPYHTSTTVPPPPPPRPAEYEAQIQAAHHNRTGTPHQEYSFQPPTHHYDPPTLPQNAWNTPHGQPAPLPYHPTPPPLPQASGVLDGPLVSPIDSTSGYWGSGAQSHSSTSQALNHYNPPAAIQTPAFKPAFSQALGFGGPSDWEHYDPNAPPPDQTPTSPPSNSLYQGPISPPQAHQTLPATYQTPKLEPVLPTHAVEIGVASPVTPRKDSRTQPPPAFDSAPSPPSQPDDERPSTAGYQRGDVSARSDSLNGTGIDSVIQAWNAPLNVRSAQDATPRPESRGSAPRVTSPEPGLSPVSVKVVDPYADLEPEFKASLKRYAAMLRKEAEAETDDDKFEIFQSFVTKELRLRSLLYGVELKKEAAKEVKKAASLADIQAMLPNSSFRSSETGRDPDRGSDSVGRPSAPVPAPSLPQQSQPSINPAPEPAQANVGQKEPPKPGIPKPSEAVAAAPVSPVKAMVEPRPKSKDGPHVVIPVAGHDDAYSPGGRPVMTKVADDGEEQAYSPGGRPIATKPTNEEGERYSPGGRPIAAKSVAPSSTKPPFISTLAQPHLPQRSEDLLSPSNDAPMVIEDYATPDPASPSMNAPIVVIPEAPQAQASPGRPSQGNAGKPVVPIKFEPSRPAYTPFRYNVGVQEEKSKTLKPADQAYSSLRNSVADSGRLMAQDTTLLAPVRPSSTSGKKEHEEAFIGLIRKQSMAVRQKNLGPGPGPPPPGIRPGGESNRTTPSPRPEPPPFMRVGTPATASIKPPQAPMDPLKAAVAALRSLLPPATDIFSPIEANPEHPKLKLIKSKIDSIPDAFSFIHDTVVEWDRTNRLVRKEQEAERQARQEESEGHIDALFNDNEIGYADIGELEAEFKLKEAERRFDEDQAELESFTSQVFVVVSERLQKEITELMTAYTMAIDLLDMDSLAVSRCFKANDRMSAVRMTEVMSYVLTLFNKIEIRHTKVAEAHVERERRRKHLELTVLYTNGDVQGVKKLEKEFAVAEKMAVLHEARGRDNRANKLMDSFDRATVRGLGDNQVFTDEVLSKLQDLKRAIDAGAIQNEKERLFEADGARDTLSLAQNALDTVMADSRRLLALSNEADLLLNDADYNVSVAEARVANADKPTYATLESEKAKEDAKLIEEMNVRISSVTRGPQEGTSLIRGMTDRIGDDPAHQERIKKALEAAKMRNANGPSEAG